MSWSLAHNLRVRHDAVEAVWPGTVIGEVGDPAHLAEQSDHNPDARGIVHAIDIMTYGDEAKAAVVLDWLADAPGDLEYWIHALGGHPTIWSRSHGFIARPYTGSNPHTDHVHVSGRHGTVGENAQTGTGYSTAAEAMTPEGIDMLTAQQVWDAPIHNSVTGTDVAAHVFIDTINRQVDENKDTLAELKAELDALKTLVTPAL